MAAVLDVEGSFDLDGDLEVLRAMHRLGLRSAQLSAHNWTSNFADSCCSTPKNGGLNERGRAWVREMNRLGMVINVSHASDEAMEQAIDVSSDPVVATHHGLRSVNDIPRNMPEGLMRKLAAKGGVFGFQLGNEFHNRKAFDWAKAHRGEGVLGHERDSGARAAADRGDRQARRAAVSDEAGGDPGRGQAGRGRMDRGGGEGDRDCRGGSRVAGERLRRGSAAASGDAGCAGPGDADGLDAAAGVDGGESAEVPGWEFVAGIREGYGEEG